MIIGESQEQISIRRMAWRGLRKNFSDIMNVALVTVLLRVLIFLPMLLCVDYGGKLPMWMGWVMAAAVYIAGVIPMRFWGREKMRRMFYSRHLNHRKTKIYQNWLKTGLLRYIRGILWGLPFLAGMVYFTVFRTTLDAKTFWMPIRYLAVLLGQEPNLGGGLAAALVLMIIFGLLFAYGWWRDLPVEYLPVRSLETNRTMHWSRRIRKKHKGEMRRNTLVNFFLSLPALIGLGVVLVPYVRANISFSLSADMIVNQILRMLRNPLPNEELMKLAAVAAVLYVPFWIFRKTRNAAFMGIMMQENTNDSHSSGHKSAEIVTPQASPKYVDFHADMGNGEEKETPPAKAGEKNDDAKDAVLRAQEAARRAREAAENAARLAQEAARMAQEAAKYKKE